MAFRFFAQNKTASVKALLLVLFLASALYVFRHTEVGSYLSPERLTHLIHTAGIWAPLAYVLLYGALVCLFVPATLMTALGAAIFGAYWGFLYVWIGAMIGASGAFFIGRYLGRDFAASLVNDRLRKYDEAIERNGFATVLYLRLIYFPFTPMSFGMGLTRVSFRDYFSGTALGILVGTFIFTFFIGTAKDAWLSGQWDRLADPKLFLSLGLFVFSFFIPRLVQRLKVWRKLHLE
ncbi:MAG TPA: TVP38/TMEM64 family protein [Syntrophobacteraceae bacterium]|nr:TVP38/TMEM64 family protein [Syntrophobacteraceae bacterium]